MTHVDYRITVTDDEENDMTHALIVSEGGDEGANSWRGRAHTRKLYPDDSGTFSPARLAEWTGKVIASGFAKAL